MVSSDAVSGIGEINTTVEIKEVQYYTIMGQRLNRPMIGMNIVKTVYENGKVCVQKIQIK